MNTAVLDGTQPVVGPAYTPGPMTPALNGTQMPSVAVEHCDGMDVPAYKKLAVCVQVMLPPPRVFSTMPPPATTEAFAAAATGWSSDVVSTDTIMRVPPQRATTSAHVSDVAEDGVMAHTCQYAEEV